MRLIGIASGDYFQMQEMLEQNQRLFPQQLEPQPEHLPTNPYVCNSCQRIAEGPVVPPCGHIYCWECLRSATSQPFHVCYVCRTKIDQEELRSIFVRQQSRTIDSSGKPVSKYCEPIRNSTGVNSSLPTTFSLPHNVQRGRLLAGAGLMPSQPILALNSSIEIEGESDQSEKEADALMGWIRRVLVLFLLLAVGLALFK